MGNSVTGAASTVVIAFVALLACKVAEAVIEPAIFAIFIIVIAWPMLKALQPILGKAAALTITIVVTAAVVLSFISMIVWSGGEVADWVRQNLDRIQETLLSSTSWLEQHDIFIFAFLEDHFKGAALMRILQRIAMRANAIMAFALVVLVYVILGLAELESFQSRIAALQNRETSLRLLTVGARIGKKFRAFMFVRTLASVATGLAVWGLTRYKGVELSGAWGVMTFALNYLPYIGSLIGTVLLPVFAFVQFGSLETPLMILLGLIVINFIIGSLFEPAFAGATLAISPPLVLFTIALWTFLWGALGAFLGVPLAIAGLTIFEQFPSTRWISDLFSGKGTGGSSKVELQ